MQSSTCKFWVGLGLGSGLGAVVYRCSRTSKAKELKQKMCCAAQSAVDKAGEWMANAKDKASEMGQKVADEVADKAEEAKNKFHAYTDAKK